MTAAPRFFTAEDLWQMPTDQPWELWDGELRVVPGAGGEASSIAGTIGTLVLLFVRPRGLGLVTAADGTYILARDPDTVLVPDAAFVRWDRLPNRTAPKGYSPVAPDLAVEVRSPLDRPKDIVAKLEHYRRARMPLVWWVDPACRTVAVYRDGQFIAALGEGDELDGGDVLPGLRFPVAEIFAWPSPTG